jgi:hypothetical protein
MTPQVILLAYDYDRFVNVIRDAQGISALGRPFLTSFRRFS